MLTIGGFAIDISKIIEGVLIAALGGIVGFAIGKVRDIKRKKKKREAQRKKQVEPILTQLKDVVGSPDIERCRNIAQMIANNWITRRTKCLKANEDAQTYIRYFMEDLYDGRCQRVLRRSDTISDIQEKLELLMADTACDGTKARVFINTSGEKEMEDYEKCLEDELLSKCKTKIDSWSRDRTGGDCQVLVFGGMRIDVAVRLIGELQESVKGPVSVGVYKKSVSESFVSGLRDFAESKGEDVITVYPFEDGTLTEGYDVIICTHYWQHRPLGDLMNMRFHLKDGGLFIWLSATSRGSGKKDVEFVCEGFPPLSPSSVETNFDCTSHNSKEQPYGVAIPYTPMGQYCEKKKWIKYDCLTWGCQSFYDCHLPKSYTTSVKDVCRCFDSVTPEFLTWYLSKFGFSKVEVNTTACISANDETRKRFGDEHYIICSVTCTKDDNTPMPPQYLIAVVARSDNSNNNHLVSLYPCIRAKSSKKNLSRDGIMTFLRDTKMSDQHVAVDREYIACDESSYVFRVLSRIRCPIAKQYLFALSGGWMYVACLPIRTYLTQKGYEAARKELVDYDSRIEDFKRENGSKARFCPYRMDSVTILMPYNGIKGILAERHIEVDDDSTFFHKCYGALNESVPSGLTKTLSKVLPNPDDLGTLRSDIASVEKDCAFNKLPMDNRLKLLGCMNVHDVLLFGIKKQ